ncbi:NUDIX domain-containing protein [Geobacillus kaustophilus]|uniref:NUDIX domain-containing protein n=1 Tax=Geobacillus kaustophilus TaxID=1462 RepID=UPI0009D70273
MRIRKCARAVIINERNEILLQQFEFRDVVGNKVLWVTPGGGIEENETPAEALKRELYEELGIVVDLLGGPIFQLDVWIEGKQGSFISRETRVLIIQNYTYAFHKFGHTQTKQRPSRISNREEAAQRKNGERTK